MESLRNQLFLPEAREICLQQSGLTPPEAPERPGPVHHTPHHLGYARWVKDYEDGRCAGLERISDRIEDNIARGHK